MVLRSKQVWRQTKRLLPRLGATALVPLLHLSAILILSLRDRQPLTLNRIALRFLMEEALLALSIPAALHGRYPTLAETMRVPIGYLISLLVCWLLLAAPLSLAWNGLHRLLSCLSRRARLWGAGLVLALLLVWLVWPVLPSRPRARIIVDAATALDPMPDHQRGFSQGGEVEMQEPGYFERAMTRIGELNPCYVRIDHIYDYYGVYQIDAAGKPVYVWNGLDRVVDAILSSGATPFICVSYLPPALARESIYGPPTDLAAWKTLVYETVYHLNVERDLGIVHWEVWNEPNLPHFWSGTLDEYLQLYQATVRGALRADPSILVGGPATASLEHWSRAGTPFYERNWIVGLTRFAQEHALPLDFLSWHYYDTAPKHYAWSVRKHQRWTADLDPSLPLMLTEWNWSGSVPHPEFDTGETVAYTAAVVATLADTPLEQAFFFEPMDSSTAWDGRWGMIRADGVVKPVYNGFLLLSELGGERLAVEGSHPHVGALATRKDDGILVLLWHYGGSRSSLDAELSIVGLPAGSQWAAYIYGVDAEHGNPYSGTDDRDLLVERKDIEATASVGLSLRVGLPRDGIRLIRIARSE